MEETVERIEGFVSFDLKGNGNYSSIWLYIGATIGIHSSIPCWKPMRVPRNV